MIRFRHYMMVIGVCIAVLVISATNLYYSPRFHSIIGKESCPDCPPCIPDKGISSKKNETETHSIMENSTNPEICTAEPIIKIVREIEVDEECKKIKELNPELLDPKISRIEMPSSDHNWPIDELQKLPRVGILLVGDHKFANMFIRETTMWNCYALMHKYHLFFEFYMLHQYSCYKNDLFFNKWRAIIKYLPHFQWLFVSDYDTIVANVSLSLEMWLDDSVDILVQQRNNKEILAGNIFIRNSKNSFDFVRKMLAYDAEMCESQRVLPNSDNGAFQYFLSDFNPACKCSSLWENAVERNEEYFDFIDCVFQCHGGWHLEPVYVKTPQLSWKLFGAGMGFTRCTETGPPLGNDLVIHGKGGGAMVGSEMIACLPVSNGMITTPATPAEEYRIMVPEFQCPACQGMSEDEYLAAKKRVWDPLGALGTPPIQITDPKLGQCNPVDSYSHWIQDTVDPNWNPDDLLIVVMSGSPTVMERGNAIESTWGKHVRNLVYVLDKNVSGCCGSHDSLLIDSKPDYRGANERIVAGLKMAVESPKYQNVKWFMLVDDDTFVIWKRLFDFVSKLHPDRPAAFGFCFDREKHSFLSGGAGILFAREAAMLVSSKIPNSPCNISDVEGDPDLVYYDYWMGRCMKHVGVFTMGGPMMPESPDGMDRVPEYLAVATKEHRSYALSYHYIQPEDMPTLYDEVLREEL